jgi:hypothetical protein
MRSSSARFLEGVPECGRMAARVSRVRSDEEHNTRLGRTQC